MISRFLIIIQLNSCLSFFFLSREENQFRDIVWKLGIKTLAVGIVIDSNKSFLPCKIFAGRTNPPPLMHLLANFVSSFFSFFLFFSLPEESRGKFENGGGSTPRVSVTFTHDDIISRVRDSRPPLSRPRYRQDVARIFISREVFEKSFSSSPRSFFSDYHLNSKRFKNEWISISPSFHEEIAVELGTDLF